MLQVITLCVSDEIDPQLDDISYQCFPHLKHDAIISGPLSVRERNLVIISSIYIKIF